MSLISSLAWVKRGITEQNPKKVDVDEDELARISALAKVELEDARMDLKNAQKEAEEMDKRRNNDEKMDDDNDDEDNDKQTQNKNDNEEDWEE